MDAEGDVAITPASGAACPVSDVTGMDPVEIGAPDWIRTSDLQLRSATQTLRSSSLDYARLFFSISWIATRSLGIYGLRLISTARGHSWVTPQRRQTQMPHTKLRQALVHSLPYLGSGKAQCIYWDEGLPTFGLRIYSSGKRVYVCSYRVGRRKRLASLGRADVLALEEARRRAKHYLGQVATGADPKALSDEERASVTIKALVEQYLEKHAKLKKKTWRHDRSLFSRLLIPKYGAWLVTALTSAEIQDIHALKGMTTPGEANSFVKVARKMFNWGKTAMLVAENKKNPATGIVPFPIRRRRRYVTNQEMPRLLAALEREDNEYARHAIWLLLLTGLRVNEVLRAKWSDVDWTFKTLFIGLTKNGEPVLTPLSEAAIVRLQRICHREGNDHIICGAKSGSRLVNLRKPWVRIRELAGIPDLRLHDVRRTVGSWLVQDGATLHLVGSVLNHKDPKTTAGYAYFQTQQREAALTRHGRQLLELLPSSASSEQPQSYDPKPTVIDVESDIPLPTTRVHYVDREVLFRLVWQAPVSEVARRFGISDVGLAKACKRSGVPIPARGYWAKLAAGARPSPPNLPPHPRGLPQLVRIKIPKARTMHPGDNSLVCAAAANDGGDPGMSLRAFPNDREGQSVSL
jgi:integrase